MFTLHIEPEYYADLRRHSDVRQCNKGIDSFIYEIIHWLISRITRAPIEVNEYSWFKIKFFEGLWISLNDEISNLDYVK